MTPQQIQIDQLRNNLHAREARLMPAFLALWITFLILWMVGVAAWQVKNWTTVCLVTCLILLIMSTVVVLALYLNVILSNINDKQLKIIDDHGKKS